MKLESLRSLKALMFLSIFWALGVLAAGMAALSLPEAKTDSRASEAINTLISHNETDQSLKALAAVSKSIAANNRVLEAQSSTMHSFGEAAVGVGVASLATAIASMIVLTRATKQFSEQAAPLNGP